MRKDLEKKVSQAVKFLKSIDLGGGKIEVCYSGGKDSDVILQLAKEAGINYVAIYKNTTIDPPGTIKHAKDNGCTILKPKIRFFELVRIYGLPNRYARFCCKYLKEYKVLDKAIIGVRRAESRARMERYKEPEQCRIYSKKEKVRQYFPILEWTNEDVSEFIADRKIKCHPLYYDEHGKFHVERRLGCMCCPLASTNKRLEQFKENPIMVKAYARAFKNYWDNHPNVNSRKIYSNIYEQIVRDFFFEKNTKFHDFINTMFGKIDCKKFLEDYFKIKL